MTVFDILGIVERIPYELLQKVEGVDVPKFERLSALYKQAKPHIDALKPLENEAQAIWESLQPDVDAILAAIKQGQTS